MPVKVSCRSHDSLAIFDEHSSISRMYRNLRCQHHLIQERDDQRPNIPGLTPLGFERWVTLLIRAHPEEEYRRLQKTVLDMPISNPDNRIERFPKEIPRRLFPRYEDCRVRDCIEYSISKYAAIKLPQDFNREEPQPHGDLLSRTSSINGQSCNRQKHPHRRVSFVLPNTRRDACQDLDEPKLYSGGERIKRQADHGAKTYEDNLSRHNHAGSNYKPPPRKVNRFAYARDKDYYR